MLLVCRYRPAGPWTRAEGGECSLKRRVLGPGAHAGRQVLRQVTPGPHTPCAVYPPGGRIPSIPHCPKSQAESPIRSTTSRPTPTGADPMSSNAPRRRTLKTLAVASALAGLNLAALPAFAADTIKVGVLHSLSGTMAISETVLKDHRPDDHR
ncbi:hypothetical protein Ddc_24747 [Ditylenchus destructor]|nr:hypothetical protein Ddc_24747 [Ditylenchus destructor]